MVDLTPEFRRLINEFSITDKSNKRRNNILPPTKKNVKQIQDEFLREAYRIASHISNLKSFLISFRKAYLNITRQSPTSSNLSSSNRDYFEQGLSSKVATLTDKQRDEIDVQAKTMIQQCLDRIKKLEEAEQVRQNSIMNNTWTKIFSSTFSYEERDVLAAIRSSITWYLNKRLTEVSEIQKNQQEARILKEVERRESTLYKTVNPHHSRKSSSSIQSMITEEKESSSKNEDNIIDDYDLDQHLSAEQKMMLEIENETMMKELATTLEQV
ncbi:2169_t:CDS:2, partial [Diversispora eburnea]